MGCSGLFVSDVLALLKSGKWRWRSKGREGKDIPTVSLAEAAVSCPVSIPAASFFPTFMFN